METSKNDPRSLVMFISAMLIYGSIGIFRRYIPLPSSFLASFRGIFGALFLLLLITLLRKPFRHGIGWKRVLGLFVSGAVMGFNWILLFEAYNYTTVATATLCYYMEPTIIILLSPIVFAGSEKLTARKLIAAAVALVGMVFVSGVAENGLPELAEAKGIIFGLGAAALYSVVVIMNKKLPGIDAYEKTIIQLFSAGVVLVPYILLTTDFSGFELNGAVIPMLIIVGLVHTGIAYALYFGSMDGLKAQTLAIFSYVDPISALILSALILGERMTAFGIIGAVLVLGAAIFSELSPRKS